MSAERDIRSIIDNILRSLSNASNNSMLKDLAQFAIDMIIKRTRLGYGVNESRSSNSKKSSGLKKVKLKTLSEKYKKFRKGSDRLSNLTKPNKSNLTFTGQLLKSMQIIKIGRGSVVIGPKGIRDDGKANEDIGEYVTDKGRPFNDLYDLEQGKLERFYRKTFGDLLKKNKLLKY
jgi:hypothetical protein